MTCPMAHSSVGRKIHHFNMEHIKSHKETEGTAKSHYGLQQQREKAAIGKPLKVYSIRCSMWSPTKSVFFVSLVRTEDGQRSYPIVKGPWRQAVLIRIQRLSIVWSRTLSKLFILSVSLVMHLQTEHNYFYLIALLERLNGLFTKYSHSSVWHISKHLMGQYMSIA